MFFVRKESHNSSPGTDQENSKENKGAYQRLRMFFGEVREMINYVS
jgi:hypothetical protein